LSLHQDRKSGENEAEGKKGGKGLAAAEFVIASHRVSKDARLRRATAKNPDDGRWTQLLAQPTSPPVMAPVRAPFGGKGTITAGDRPPANPKAVISACA